MILSVLSSISPSHFYNAYEYSNRLEKKRKKNSNTYDKDFIATTVSDAN